jgi:hypothetical protein
MLVIAIEDTQASPPLPALPFSLLSTFLRASHRPHGVDPHELVAASRGEIRMHDCKVQMARGGVNSLFKNLQASLNKHVSIKDG